MNRISTSSSYLAVIANLNDAQARQIEAGRQVSSQRKADDLKGYARSAETLTAMQGVSTRLQGFIEQSDVLADRFTAQDAALNQLADSVGNMRQAITDAIASGRADTLMQELRGYFTDAVAALNSRNQGKYIFAGGQIDNLPVSATSMYDLTTSPTIPALFHNDDFKAVNRLDETATIQGSFLADDLGTPIFNALKTIQAYDETPPNGPITGAISQTQVDFLQAQIAGLDTIHENLTNAAAINGSYQRRIEDNKKDLVGRKTTLENMMGNVTDVDVAEAISRLQMAQTAVQASAQVFQGLQSSSLLNFLRL
jgi:flagellar hook-associated protein 3 FlgL